MKKLILANSLIGEPQFQSPARERVAAVRALLTTEGKLPAERIFEKGGIYSSLPRRRDSREAGWNSAWLFNKAKKCSLV